MMCECGAILIHRHCHCQHENWYVSGSLKSISLILSSHSIPIRITIVCIPQGHRFPFQNVNFIWWRRYVCFLDFNKLFIHIFVPRIHLCLLCFMTCAWLDFYPYIIGDQIVGCVLIHYSPFSTLFALLVLHIVHIRYMHAFEENHDMNSFELGNVTIMTH